MGTVTSFDRFGETPAEGLVQDRVEPLPLSERIELYRKRAARMMKLAATCESEGVRLAYLKLAAHWQDLIVDLEQGRTPLPEFDDSDHPHASDGE